MELHHASPMSPAGAGMSFDAYQLQRLGVRRDVAARLRIHPETSLGDSGSATATQLLVKGSSAMTDNRPASAVRCIAVALLVSLFCIGCTDVRPVLEDPALEARTNPFDEDSPPACGGYGTYQEVAFQGALVHSCVSLWL